MSLIMNVVCRILLLRPEHTGRQIAATRCSNKFHRVNRRILSKILSLQHVAQNQTRLILCDMLQRETSVTATKF